MRASRVASFSLAVTLPKVLSVGWVEIHGRKVVLIESVESFGAELEAYPLGDAIFLNRPEIDVIETRIVNVVPNPGCRLNVPGAGGVNGLEARKPGITGQHHPRDQIVPGSVIAPF